MCKSVVIIGAGGHSRVVADIVKKCGDKVVGFLDDFNTGENILGTVADCVKFKDCSFVIAIGLGKVRKNISEKYPGLDYYTAVHPCAVVSENVTIGKGTVVMANAVINAGAVIGMHSIINTSSVIEHDNRLGNYVHVSPGAVLCGTVTVGDNTHIGAGSVVRNNITICENCVVGCGSAVVKDITQSGVYSGVPARMHED
jgi:sugar O-acyltransferase (sialic acid O-acetyltransferase NeuD family)